MTMKPSSLVGQDESHLCSADDAARLAVSVHSEVVHPFDELRDAAAMAGFDVVILSGFRGFDRQLSIWNRKARGELPVLDSNARPLDIATLAPHDLVFSILRWSALPGASRHHWGTDIDVYDAASRPPGYEVELLPAEYDDGGPFAPFSRWLDERIANRTAAGFFRPYDRDRGGVAPERWHLSYGPLSSVYARMLTTDVLRQAIESADMMLKDVVLEHLDQIFSRFVTNTNPDTP